MARGPASAGEVRGLRGDGGFAVLARLDVGGVSIVAAVAMGLVRPPSENSVAGRPWWLADQLCVRPVSD
eukprot:7396842-Pyramimonas_sp.AAC.1